jgi:rhodanese-related sulfurtransferase
MPDFIEPTALAAERETSREDLTILDVRSPEEYAKGHVEGAINIPLAELEGRVGDMTLGTEIVSYCNMYHPGSSRGEQAADVLTRLGFDAKTLLGGFPAWRDAGLPVESETSGSTDHKHD